MNLFVLNIYMYIVLYVYTVPSFYIQYIKEHRTRTNVFGPQFLNMTFFSLFIFLLNNINNHLSPWCSADLKSNNKK